MAEQVLIATLGSEPQVVALALDLVLMKGYEIREVIVVHFVERWLTPAEREVVRLVCQGLDNTAIARRLGKKGKTVANQLTEVYAKLHEWRGFRTDVPVSRAVLVAEFAGYVALEGTSPLSPLRRGEGRGGEGGER